MATRAAPVNESANRLNGLADLPAALSERGPVNPDYYAYDVLKDVNPAFWDGTKMNLPPPFGAVEATRSCAGRSEPALSRAG